MKWDPDHLAMKYQCKQMQMVSAILHMYKVYTVTCIALPYDHPAAPSAPENLQPLSICARNITVTWDPPLKPNGVINIYRVELMSEDGNITQQNTTQRVAVFTDLSPSTPYAIQVQALTVEFGDFGPLLMISTLPGECV